MKAWVGMAAVSATAHVHGEAVDSGWAINAGAVATISGQADGAVNLSGTNLDVGVHTRFDEAGSAITLNDIGDSITLTGSIFINGTLAGINSHPGSIRFGLYDVNGSSDTTGWHGYFGLFDTTGTAGTSGGLFEKTQSNTSNFFSGTGASRLNTYAGTESALVAGTTYDILMTVTKTAGGVQIDASAKNAADANQLFLNSSFLDATTTTTTFNRVGFYVSASGGGVGAETFNLSNVGVTTAAAIPEPEAYGLIGAGAVAIAALRRMSGKNRGRRATREPDQAC